MSEAPKTSVLSELILDLAYKHPLANECLMVNAPSLCPRCQCEFTFIIEDQPGRLLLSCQYCGLVFKPKELAA